MARFKDAPDDVVELVQGLISLYHEPLQDAKIGLLMRDEAPASGSMITLGQARKVSPEHRVLMDFDFIIWFAQDEWDRLSTLQRRALADHELCHCSMWRGKTSIRRHDFEEFNCIIERYGFWRPTGKWTEKAVQTRLGFEYASGKVTTVNLQKASMDILDQIGDMFEGKGDDENGVSA